MVCLSTKVLSRMAIIGKKPTLEALRPCWLRMSHLARRLSSTGSAPFGSAPFQTPVEGHEWEEIIKNYQDYKSNPPFSQREIVLIRRQIKMQKCFDKIREKIEDRDKFDQPLSKKLRQIIEPLK